MPPRQNQTSVIDDAYVRRRCGSQRRIEDFNPTTIPDPAHREYIYPVTAIPLLLSSQIHLKLGTQASYSTTSLNMTDGEKTTSTTIANKEASAKSQADSLLVYLEVPPKVTGVPHGTLPPKKESILIFGGKYDSELIGEPALLCRWELH